MKKISMFFAAAAVAAAVPVPAQTPAASPFTPGTHAVKIAVEDFKKSTDFYVALGMKAGADRGTTRELVWEGATRNSGIIMAGPQYAANAKMTRGGTTLMITTPDFKAVLARLAAAGFPQTGQPRVNASAATMMVTDPDGNKVELMGPAPK